MRLLLLEVLLLLLSSSSSSSLLLLLLLLSSLLLLLSSSSLPSSPSSYLYFSYHFDSYVIISLFIAAILFFLLLQLLHNYFSYYNQPAITFHILAVTPSSLLSPFTFHLGHSITERKGEWRKKAAEMLCRLAISLVVTLFSVQFTYCPSFLLYVRPISTFVPVCVL